MGRFERAAGHAALDTDLDVEMLGYGEARTGGVRATDRGADPVRSSARVVGVDVARGAALIAMMAAHTIPVLGDQGEPTTATVVTAGRSAATFVLIAGVSLAFMSGGRRVVRGPERTAAAAGLVVRAVLIGLVGFALGMLGDLHGVDGILQFYAVLFLLAIPLLGLPPLMLAGLAAAVVVAGPVLLVATAGTRLADLAADGDPSFATLASDPLGVLVQLFVTGEFPVVVYMAYICAGLAIGRLDLASRRVAGWLFGAGVALAAVAQVVSALLLYPLGGMAALVAADPYGESPADTVSYLLWDPDSVVASWWYLALPSPHSHSTLDLVHTLGSAMAVLGAALLLTRVRVLARVLSPVAAAGAMVLTLYTAHLLLLASGVLEDRPGVLFVAMLVGALVVAVLWRRWAGQGPLERIVALAAGATRRRVADRSARGSAAPPGDEPRAAGPRPGWRPSHVLVPVACAAILVLALVAGTRVGPDQERPVPAEEDEPVPSVVTGAAPTAPQAVEAPGAPDLGSYCLLSEQVGDLEDQFEEDPRALVAAAGPRLTDMTHRAPAEIRDAVGVYVADLRAEAGEPGVQAPDDTVLDQSETSIDTFEELHCP
jgi:uncharacterized membrane protein